MKESRLPGGITRWETEGGTLEARMPAPHVLVMRCTGFGGSEFIPVILGQRERLLAQPGNIHLFDDMEETTGYATDARMALTQWMLRNRARIASLHILTHSRMVAMGVTVANLALGGFLTSHADRASFDAALATLLASPARTPARP